MTYSKKFLTAAACGTASLACLIAFAAQPPAAAPTKPVPPVMPTTFPNQPTPPVRTPQEEATTFQLPEGYSMELVLSDPDIKEPVQAVFDGNGRMYVDEMRTYMQDIDGTNELTPGGRVSRHESTRGDGVFDKHTVYADNLLLPRMILPLDRGQLIIGQTNTSDLHVFSDSKDAGVSDGKTLFYEGGPRGGNLEHQPSGLMWSMDNWIYTTVNAYRLRWQPKGPATRESTASNGGQWGLSQDDDGKPWWSNAGGEKGLWHFQTPIEYASIDVKEQFEPTTFLEVWPDVHIPDVQGGTGRYRAEEKTLNHMTASGGQDVFRGDRLPADLKGDALICEPVGRLIRRAKVTVDDGITHLTNPYEAKKSEFIRSTDPYFRPVNMTTGPDGCLYIVDMYRGIIQEGNWVREGSYLRKIVRQYGLDKAVGHGRVWRLVHKDFKPGPQPHMLDEAPAQLVAHLEHPNGWWRDAAQKLLVLRQDKSVVPELTRMVRTSTNPLARMHAMWTLEGLGAIDAGLLREKFKDATPRVRTAAIRVSETLFKRGDDSLRPDVLALAADTDPTVQLQVVMTAKVLNWPGWKEFATLKISKSPSHGVQEIGRQLLYTPKQFDKRAFAGAQMKLLSRGQEIYQELCFACHGYDGLGMPMDGKPPGTTVAPPLAGAPLVLGPPDGILALLLHGMGGPVDGKAYDAQMIPMRDNDDEWVASVASFVRNSFGNRASTISAKEVAAMRVATKGRTVPWTIEELRANVLPPTLANAAQWKATASANPKAAPLAIDGKMETRYCTGIQQAPGQWFQVELPEETLIAGVQLDTGNSKGDYPRGYKVELSSDGSAWGKPVAEGKGAASITEIMFPPRRAKFVRVTQTGSTKGTFWSIHELRIYQPPKLNATAAR